MSEKKQHLVQRVRQLTNEVYVIRIDRHDFRALAGQHVTLGPHQFAINREFSIYSSPEKPYLEFIIRARAGSETALALQKAQPGDQVDLAGPYGEFMISEPENEKRRHLFIATGVGIAPFHCFVTHYPNLDYRMIHGISRLEDRFEIGDYARERYIACVSKEEGGDFYGRVTDYIQDNPVESNCMCYICGRSGMVASVYDILREQGIHSDNILTETFF